VIQLRVLKLVKMNNIISVAIADDCQVFRYLMRKIISDSDDFNITIEAANGKELISNLGRSARLPQICVIDIGMPVMDGYKTIELIMKRWPYIKVLVYSQYYHPYAIGTMIKLGAKGFISKTENTKCILEALASIKEHGYFYSKYVTKQMFEMANNAHGEIPQFTSVEKHLLALFCTDMQYSKIAEKLHISKNTIEKHKQNISRKIGINSREGLMLFAIQNDLLDLHDAIN